MTNPGAQGKGLNVNIFTKPDIAGKTLNEESSFVVDVEISNYIPSSIRGDLCLRDESTNNYGGVDDNQCQAINIVAAERISNKLVPSGISIPFPSAGEYFYKNLPTNGADNRIFADLYYETETIADASNGCVSRSLDDKSCNSEQRLSVSQSEAPLQVSSIKFTPIARRASQDVTVKTEITISQVDDGSVLNSGTSFHSQSDNPSIGVNVLINNQKADCTGSSFSHGQLVVRNSNAKIEKVINCNTIVNIATESVNNIPVTVQLEYGFKKTIYGPSFKLKKSIEELIS